MSWIEGSLGSAATLPPGAETTAPSCAAPVGTAPATLLTGLAGVLRQADRDVLAIPRGGVDQGVLDLHWATAKPDDVVDRQSAGGVATEIDRRVDDLVEKRIIAWHKGDDGEPV